MGWFGLFSMGSWKKWFIIYTESMFVFLVFVVSAVKRSNSSVLGILRLKLDSCRSILLMVDFWGCWCFGMLTF